MYRDPLTGPIFSDVGVLDASNRCQSLLYLWLCLFQRVNMLSGRAVLNNCVLLFGTHALLIKILFYYVFATLL